MHVGGSKDSISGNFAMKETELAIFVGSRGVCQIDCSGIGSTKVQHLININTDLEDVLHYNQTLALNGYATIILSQLTERLETPTNKAEWLACCAAKKA